MLFNSPEFLLLFLPVMLAGFALLLRGRRGAMAAHWLLAGSLFFYAWWDPRYLPLLLLSIGVNYLLGKALRESRSKGLLAAGVAFNLGLLGFFKYAGFFAATANQLGAVMPVPQLALPLAISFFTFQQIAYLADARQGKAGQGGILEYALFVAFFPQLIAGPIVHHREMMPQFARLGGRTRVHALLRANGVFLIALGLFKKVIVADTLGGIADPVFAEAQAASFFDAWTGILAYTLQLYFDFSAYSEMAMGLALLFGIRLPLNFNSPYKASSIGDFWRRWHITLGRFLRDYLYIPLGGSRAGVPRTLFALAATMLLAGLWHGAGWTFVLWGALHGLYLGAYHLWRRLPWRLPGALAWGLTFLSVVWAWVLFRAESLADALHLWAAMAGAEGLVLPQTLREPLGFLDGGVQWAYSPLVTGLELLLILPLVYIVATQPNVHELFAKRYRPDWRWGFAAGGAASLAVAQLGHYSVFQYWQF